MDKEMPTLNTAQTESIIRESLRKGLSIDDAKDMVLAALNTNIIAILEEIKKEGSESAK